LAGGAAATGAAGLVGAGFAAFFFELFIAIAVSDSGPPAYLTW
jgi:hypothetical protein